MDQVLTRRAQNRATLERQLLLRRSTLPVASAVEHLVGLQAQTPHTWYVGLWSRLAGFRPEHAADLLEGRDLVRIVLMRGTIHLVTPADAVTLRPLVQPVLDRDLAHNALHTKPLTGIDLPAVAAAARTLLGECPMTSKELGALLTERWPGRPGASLAYAARNLLPLVQVPPRGLWGRSGPIAHTTAETWLGGGVPATLSVPQLILRYLAAFGPASTMDVQTWCGLTRLRELVDDLRPGLITFRDESGRELFDLPDAPRPDPETPAPPRFLYDFDNLLLSHADRTRVVTEDYHRQAYPPNGPVPQLVLIDGFTCGDWKITREKSLTRLLIHPYRRLTARETSALTKEARGLLDFHAPGATHDLRIEPT